MSSPVLFQPHRLGPLTLNNRIVIPPMCQYSANAGQATDWHTMHWGNLLQSGAGLFIIEATAVSPDGRISAQDLGLWDDDTERAIAHTLSKVRAYSDMPMGIQLAHAGRKASTQVPWQGGQQIAPDQPNGWQTIAPSDCPYAPDEHPPQAMDAASLSQIKQAFVDAAERAVRLGFELIELHMAHGYLLHQFLSPIANQRTDSYGGTLENRMRYPLEVFDAVRRVVPSHVALGVRVSTTDWVEGGWDNQQTQALAKALAPLGCDFIDASSGGLSPAQKIPVGPNYQVPDAQAIKQNTSLPVITVGLITKPEQAEAIVSTQQADFVAIGRGILFDPRWPWHAAAALGAEVKVSPQYLRCQPHGLNSLLQPRTTA